jgi:NAD(P)-dependent dehydrogenase (short-subunit alcohol dehydrogenase family)
VCTFIDSRTPAIERVMADPASTDFKLISGTLSRIPVAARLGEPGEVAYAVAVLCEDEASWINGQHIHVSGGLALG